MVEYTKKDYNFFIDMFLNSSIIHNIMREAPDLFEYIQKILKSPKLVKQGFSQEFLSRSKFFK